VPHACDHMPRLWPLVTPEELERLRATETDKDFHSGLPTGFIYINPTRPPPLAPTPNYMYILLRYTVNVTTPYECWWPKFKEYMQGAEGAINQYLQRQYEPKMTPSIRKSFLSCMQDLKSATSSGAGTKLCEGTLLLEVTLECAQTLVHDISSGLLHPGRRDVQIIVRWVDQDRFGESRPLQPKSKKRATAQTLLVTEIRPAGDPSGCLRGNSNRELAAAKRPAPSRSIPDHEEHAKPRHETDPVVIRPAMKHALPSRPGAVVSTVPSNLRHPLPARPNMHYSTGIPASSTRLIPRSALEPRTVVPKIRPSTAEAPAAITTAQSTLNDGHTKEPRKTRTAAAKHHIEDSLVPGRKKAKRESKPPVCSDGGNSAGSDQVNTPAVGGSGSSTTSATKAILSSGKTQENVIDLTGDDDD